MAALSFETAVWAPAASARGRSWKARFPKHPRGPGYNKRLATWVRQTFLFFGRWMTLTQSLSLSERITRTRRARRTRDATHTSTSGSTSHPPCHTSQRRLTLRHTLRLATKPYRSRIAGTKRQQTLSSNQLAVVERAPANKFGRGRARLGLASAAVRAAVPTVGRRRLADVASFLRSLN